MKRRTKIIWLTITLLVAIGYLASTPVTAETIEGGYGYGYRLSD